jgi:DNA-binding transcriptional ArsR family regulator
MVTLGSVFSALSDATRRAIIHRLAGGPACVRDIAAPFSISLNTVSNHIEILERAGLVRRMRQGPNYFRQFECEPLREVARWTRVYERFWNQHLAVLKYLLERGKRK